MTRFRAAIYATTDATARTVSVAGQMVPDPTGEWVRFGDVPQHLLHDDKARAELMMIRERLIRLLDEPQS